MNGFKADLEEIAQIATSPVSTKCEVLICPPATLLPLCAERFGNSALKFGAQDCHELEKGAYTGDISAPMLKDAGASYVILGHSERRQYHRETNAQVCLKAEAAQHAGLTPIICVGETLKQREAGEALEVIEEQLYGSLPDNKTNIVIAYEPVWAIGTGRVASIEDISAIHNFMRDFLDRTAALSSATIRLLYGGSVKANNAAAIIVIPNVNGALVGGASLKAKDFLPIIEAVQVNALYADIAKKPKLS